MWILVALGIFGTILGFLFLALAIASGLYYLAELLEEHTVPAKKLLTKLVYTVMAILALLWVGDGFPLTYVAFSIASHYVYLQNLRRFPVVKLLSPTLLASCVLVFVNHFIWFRHFTSPPSLDQLAHDSQNPYSINYIATPSFTQVASFFGICVWLVPFALFLGLSAGENVLPSMGSEYATGPESTFFRPGKEPHSHSDLNPLATGSGGGRVNIGLVKAGLANARAWIGEVVGAASASGRRGHARTF